MSNEMPSESRESHEHIPTPEEVLSVFKELIGEAEFEEIQRLHDEKGLFRYEIIVREKDGGYRNYFYRRGRPAAGELQGLRIELTYFDAEDNPISGHSVGKFIGGRWNLTP